MAIYVIGVMGMEKNRSIHNGADRKVKGLITLQLAKALVFSQYLPNASFFLNFG